MGNRTSKPPFGTGIDTGASISANLIMAYAFNEGSGTTLTNAVDSSTITPNTAISWGANGAQPTGTSNNLGAWLTMPRPVTLVMKFTPTSATNGYFMSPALYDDYVALQADGTFRVRAAATTNAISVGAASVGTTVTVAFTISSADTITLYFNGSFDSQSTGFSAFTNTFNFLMGEVLLPASVDSLLIFSRELSSAEVTSVSSNPWQVYTSSGEVTAAWFTA